MNIPKIAAVTPQSQQHLLVTFTNGTQKLYDCNQLFTKPAFQSLDNPTFFKTVQVDPGGYGISWNDAIDLSEYELWNNGMEIESHM